MNEILLYSHLSCRPVEFLPEISQNDKEFAERIIQQFNLPSDEIICLVTNIRNDLDTWTMSECIPLFKNKEHKILKEAESIQVKINSESDPVIFDRTHPYYSSFISIISREVNRRQKDAKKGTIRFNNVKVREDFQKFRIFNYFNLSDLNKSQSYIAIGLFLIHFNFSGNKDLISEKDFDPAEHGEQDWQHYIIGRVNSRVKKFL